jgi:hypothetical protein
LPDAFNQTPHAAVDHKLAHQKYLPAADLAILAVEMTSRIDHSISRPSCQ